MCLKKQRKSFKKFGMSRKTDSVYSNKSFRFMVIGAAIMAFAAIVTGITFGVMRRTFFSFEQTDYTPYKSHYAYISEDPDSDFWTEVYQAAREEAESNNIYLEDFHSSIKSNYSSADLLRIAKNSAVDGIVYSGENTEEVTELINECVDAGIGAVILQNDVETSKRQCFVGINYYELGQLYADQIGKIMETDNKINSIELIVEANMSEGVSNLISMAIEDKLTEANPEGSIPEIIITRIDAEDIFGVEESIRRIFISGEELSDIMVCLNSVYTQCAYQAVVDYNRVGDVQILGYFSNDDILEAVDKQIIYSTILIDTEEMGKLSIQALHEYNEMGYTNSYLPVDMEVIGQSEAAALIRKKNSEAEK